MIQDQVRSNSKYSDWLLKLSECELFSAGGSAKEIDKIPEIFFKKRNLINYKKFK